MRSLSSRAVIWPGWLGGIALVVANLLQVGLNWWILREAADEARESSSARSGALRVAALVVANGLQTGLTWWVYRMARHRGQRIRHLVE